jgi:glycosyltransferase involved in cell wall biosynthesis
MAESEAVLGSGSEDRAPAGSRKKLDVALRKIIFVCYGPFDCNSAGHMAGFANALAGMGYSVAACAPGDVESSREWGAPAFACFTLDNFARDPEAVIEVDGAVEPERTILVCWTPREIVRRSVEPIAARYGIPYVVHLEDNEEHLAELKLQTLKRRPWRETFVPESISDPARLTRFLSRARGVTVIEERLREIVPAGCPVLLLEPGVDIEAFGTPLSAERRADIRREIGCPPETTMLVYPGNVHRANAEEVGTLYEAVRTLRSRERDVTLVRTGTDASAAAKFLKDARPQNGIITLGRVQRPFLIELLKSADLFVQPGKSGPFNDYRLPSKLPEFMAVGRPIVLPGTNVGTKLRHGIDAMLLKEGSPDEIARLVEKILSDPALAARLSTNAKAFAAQHYQPARQARKLETFLCQII